MTPMPLGPAPDSDEYPPLSALNHLLFCPRRCGLLRNEGVWVENHHTVAGAHAHRKVHRESARAEEIGRVVRGLWLVSHRHRLVGVADLVEFRAARGAAADGNKICPEPYPVEYKRGKRRKWDNDDVQLCAQALCLEEMLGVAVPAGAIFHVGSQRRREVVFDMSLRATTEDAVRRLHELLASGETPPPVPHPKCKQCSVRAVCLPELIADPTAYRRAASTLFSLPAR